MGFARIFMVLIAIIASYPSAALPSFARKYGVGCNTCHSVAPKLNRFGLAFQANHYNWPGGDEGRSPNPVRHVPLSGILTASREQSFTEGETTTDIRNVELFSADGFRIGGRRGGYFINGLAWSNSSGEPAGSLENAFVNVPFAGRTSDLAATVGQFNPLHYQWSSTTSLLEAHPAAFADSVDGFSFAEAMPGVRLEWSRRSNLAKGDGTYASIGVPLMGHINLNHGSRVGNSNGVFAHGFVRRGYQTLGLFGYTRSGRYNAGVLATHAIRDRIFLLGSASIGHDDDGAIRRLSAEVEAVPSARFAITARLEVITGALNNLAPAAGITWYPVDQRILRVTAEMSQRKGDRTLAVFARGQF